MYKDKVTKILALFAAGALLGGVTSCRSDADFRKEREEKAVSDYQQAKTREFLSGEILSLEDCINFAMTHNLKLKAASLEKDAFTSMRLAEGLGIFPKGEFAAEIRGGHSVPGALNQSGDASGFTGRLEQEFSYELLDACMAIFQTRQAHDRLLLQEKRVERLKQNISLEVSKLYYQVAALQKDMKTVKALREGIRQYKEESAKLFRLEMVNFEQMEALSRMERSLMDHEEQYENAKSRLRSLLGMYPNGDIKVNESLLETVPTLPSKVLLEQMEQVALMQRPELFMADIRSNINRTQCGKSFVQLWSALRLYRGLQIGSASDSWENIAWVAGNFLKTPELLIRCKNSLRDADLETLRSNMQGLAILAQLRMVYAGYESSMNIYNAVQQESAALAVSAKMKKGRKNLLEILRTFPAAQRKALEKAKVAAEKGRKAASLVKDDKIRKKKEKEVDAAWRKAVAVSGSNAVVKMMQRDLDLALNIEKLRIAAAMTAIRRDLALARVHGAYNGIFNAMGFENADNNALNVSVAKLEKAGKQAESAVAAVKKEYEAIKLAQQKKENARSLYESGAMAYVDKKYIQSVEYLKRAAERGNAEALFGLGKLYWNGQGVPRDYAMAVACFVKAAEMGKIEAMILSGWFYYTGGLVEKDLKMARKYYKMAADRNEERAFYWLGMIHFEMQDYKQALAYFKYAGRGGDAVAMVWAGTIYRNGLAEGKADLDKAVLWYERAAAKGDLNAMNSLYMIYKGAFEGERKMADPEKAQDWRRKYEAALKGLKGK